MEEIFRYQQLRQSQRLSDQERNLVGLALYPHKKLSDLATSLVKADTTDAYASLLSRYREQNNQAHMLEDPSQLVPPSLDPTVRAQYEWLNFKSRPITKEHFKTFVATLPVNSMPRRIHSQP